MTWALWVAWLVGMAGFALLAYVQLRLYRLIKGVLASILTRTGGLDRLTKDLDGLTRVVTRHEKRLDEHAAALTRDRTMANNNLNAVIVAINQGWDKVRDEIKVDLGTLGRRMADAEIRLRILDGKGDAI